MVSLLSPKVTPAMFQPEIRGEKVFVLWGAEEPATAGSSCSCVLSPLIPPGPREGQGGSHRRAWYTRWRSYTIPKHMKHCVDTAFIACSVGDCGQQKLQQRGGPTEVWPEEKTRTHQGNLGARNREGPRKFCGRNTLMLHQCPSNHTPLAQSLTLLSGKTGVPAG